MRIHVEEPSQQSTGTKRSYAITYRKEGECHICTSHKPSSVGYPRVRRDWKLMQLSHYIYEKYYGPVPPGKCVMHTCDNKMCINPEHLKAGTLADNNHDMQRKGRASGGSHPGEEAYNAKFTNEQVRSIRKRGIFTKAEARRLGCSSPTLYRIRDGINYQEA